MAPKGHAYFTDWIWSNTSNVHVANHRDWFTPGTFIEFESKLDTIYGPPGPQVHGIGDVSLDVRTSATDNKKTNKLVLKNVLYAPDAPTNILGLPILKDYDYDSFVSEKLGKLTEKGESKKVVALFDNPKLTKLWLVAHGRGRTSLDEGTLYMINARWSDEERLKLGKVLNQRITDLGLTRLMGTHSHIESEPPYTQEERAWLKKNWSDEFHFLQAHGLKIHSEEDREDGRRIVRMMMMDD